MEFNLYFVLHSFIAISFPTEAGGSGFCAGECFLPKGYEARENSVVGASSLAGKAPFTSGRLHPRFKLESELRIQSQTTGLIVAKSLDVSESGIAAMLCVEVQVGEVVDLEFKLPVGLANLQAVVRQRNAFRYGFQFVEPNPALQLIRDSCSVLTRA